MNNDEIVEFTRCFPNLQISEGLEVIKGCIVINHLLCGEHIVNHFEVQIDIDNLDKSLPRVYEYEKIPITYPHIYKNRMLCLSTDVEQEIFFLEGGTLTGWINEFVIPYFACMEFYYKYNRFPMGERSHDKMGIIESYMDLFNINDIKSLANMMDYILNKKYRGHLMCPCNSGKSIRNCHKNIITKWKQSSYQRLLKRDFEILIREV